MQDEHRLLPLDALVEPWVVLRPVNRASLEYLELRDSLAAVGFINSICVRPSARKPGRMEVVDGLYRYTGAVELRLPAVPCIVKHNLTDEDVLAIQIQANALRPETTPVEYARQLKRMIATMSGSLQRDITLTDVSARIHKSPEWVENQLLLLRLTKPLQLAVERGEIPLSSAYALARVPRPHQSQFADAAQTMTATEFVPLANRYAKRFKEAVCQGRMDDLYQEFQPRPHLRAYKEVLAEYQGRQSGGLFVAAAGCRTPVDAWYLALQWALHLDEASVATDREFVLQQQRRAILRSPGEEEAEP